MSEALPSFVVFHYKPTGEVCVNLNPDYETAVLKMSPAVAREFAKRLRQEADAAEGKPEPQPMGGFLARLSRSR